jgi:formate C-acetyltransferase
VFLPGERIAFLRTVKQIPDLYTPAEMEALRGTAFYAEKGCVFNISPDYATTIREGLDARRAEIAARLQQAEAERDDAAVAFLTAALSGVDAVLDLAERYRAAAHAQGLAEIADLFRACRDLARRRSMKRSSSCASCTLRFGAKANTIMGWDASTSISTRTLPPTSRPAG